MASAYLIRPYQPADAEGVREVLTATYGEQATPRSIYDWWSFGCPEAVSGFMVAEASGRVVGVQPMEVFPFAGDGGNHLGGLLTGVAVHPECRRQGIFSALVRACEREAWRLGADFVTTMPNERSRPGFLKMGYVDPGRRRLLLRPLDERALAARAVRIHGLGAVLGWIGGRVQGLLKPVPASGLEEVREVPALPQDLEQLNDAYATLFPGLRIRRSRAWWEWRYRQHPLRPYKFIEARAGARGLAGAAVLRTETRDGIRVAYLMDMVVRDSAAVIGLVHQMLAVSREAGAQMACAVVSSDPMIRALQSAGFWLVPGWAPVKRFYTVIRFNPEREPRLPAAWRRIGQWHQMLGDWDNL